MVNRCAVPVRIGDSALYWGWTMRPFPSESKEVSLARTRLSRILSCMSASLPIEEVLWRVFRQFLFLSRSDDDNAGNKVTLPSVLPREIGSVARSGAEGTEEEERNDRVRTERSSEEI